MNAAASGFEAFCWRLRYSSSTFFASSPDFLFSAPAPSSFFLANSFPGLRWTAFWNSSRAHKCILAPSR